MGFAFPNQTTTGANFPISRQSSECPVFDSLSPGLFAAVSVRTPGFYQQLMSCFFRSSVPRHLQCRGPVIGFAIRQLSCLLFSPPGCACFPASPRAGLDLSTTGHPDISTTGQPLTPYSLQLTKAAIYDSKKLQVGLSS